MELEHRFEVPVGIDHAWSSLLDMAQVADCFPGATLTSADGQEYTGSVKIKLGPIQLTYKGSARIVEADEAAHRATIEANGSATRSSSTASMTVRATASEVASDRTAVTMTTDLTITGRPAQFGRGVMVEVGNKILGQFADCLAGKLSGSGGDEGSAAAASAQAPAEAASGAATASGGDEATKTGDGSADGAQAESSQAESSQTESPQAGDGAGAGAGGTGGTTGGGATDGPRHAATYTRSPEPIDLLESAGAPVLKRLAPVLGGLVALYLVRKLFQARRRRRAAKRAARAAARQG